MIEEFHIDVPQADLDDLRDRLVRARLPRVLPETAQRIGDPRAGADWDRGVPVGYLQRVVRYWLDQYDWRVWEARLNAFPQYTTVIDRQRIHFVHARSPEPDALPLVLTHGWPGSVAEFLDVLGPLTDPRAYGADPADAFHVVAPSVPGHGYSVPLTESGWDHVRIARAWIELMRRLGYPRYGAQGGDTGSVVSPLVGRIVPDRVVGVHLNGGLAFPDARPGDLDDLDQRDQAKLDFARTVRATGTGYAELQATKPQTVSYALADSPIGQLAWILEKFHDWTDPARPLPEDAVPLDHLLTDVSLYWFTNTAATSANLYYENRHASEFPGPSTVPTGVAVFPTDPAMRHLLEREHTITHWAEYDRGGHFATLEAPELLVDDVRAFFRPLR
ncbi:pimeloyl-ACP methyl ester carboxylesterase [Kribbella amoyensis]|uniref:Pimeloyl-ACP methyl ester carboxylesterase n=1 Tax=Kribbella amoyensis TaxID=996641 RepID=A0A561BNR3_9ACTN|nr:epoxide hydrolase family protein [Kribbella amoyensis]TWD80453.1 pimeloyl-ACP methyl ester carboxylesterase [Kribbella amoyensis]